MEQSQDTSINDSIEHEFSLSSRLNQTLGPKDAKLLRQAWLLNARELLELPHRALTLCELAQQDQPILIGHRLEKGDRKTSRLANCLDVEGFRAH